MNKLMKKIVTVALALTVVMGTVLSVSASQPEGIPAADPGLQAGVAGTITKVLEVPEGVEVPEVTFDYNVTSVSVDGATATANNMPAITGKKIEFAAGTTKDSPTSTLAAAGYDSATATLNLLSGITFTHAGVYVYNVEEDATPAVTGITYSKVAYQMTVYITNAVDGDGAIDGGFAVTNVGFKQIKDDEGEDIASPVKANPNFVNRYDKQVPLRISKEVNGNFADTTHQFGYTLVINRSAGAAVADTVGAVATGYIFNADNTVAMDGATPRKVTVTFAAGASSGTVSPSPFTLAHGQYLEFKDYGTGTKPTGADDITGLPAGTKYVLTEILGAAPENVYTPSVNVTSNGTHVGTDPSVQGSKGQSLTIGGGTVAVAPLNAPILLGEDDNIAAWTNTHEEVTPTGILLNNLPFILLIVVALGGFVLYIASKRRKAAK